MRFDVVIVGGGAAGCVIARGLAEHSDRSVLLLEAGPDVARPDSTATSTMDLHQAWRLPTISDWGYLSQHGDRLRRGRMLGGTSWLTRFAVRGAAADFEAWAHHGIDGWAWADVLPAFRAIERDLEYGDDRWHGANGPLPITRYPALARERLHAEVVEALVASGFPHVPDHNAPDAVGVGPMPMSSQDGRRVSAVDGWLGDRPASLAVRCDTVVDRVEIRAGRATGVRLADGELVEADDVILSAGTYGSPCILLRSGIGPAADLRALGIPVVHDLPRVGENLADHPAFDFDTGWLGDGVLGEDPILHSIATFRSSAGTSAAPDLLLWLSDLEAGDSFVVSLVLMKPVARGRVRLSGTAPGDPPRIALPVPVGEDRTRVLEALERTVDALGHATRAPARVVRQPSDPHAWVMENAHSVPHVVGTCRMGGRADEGAVVDQQCRVHGLAALRVVDASIFPEPPAGFPHLSVLMAAERVAAMVRAE